MTSGRRRIGVSGESLAAAYLESHGYHLIDTNVRPQGGHRRGEIDIVAWHEDVLVFVEVKSRHRALGPQGSPAEAVDGRKQRQLVALASVYLARYGLDDVPCRFDVVEVVETPDDLFRLVLIPNAFDGTPRSD